MKIPSDAWQRTWDHKGRSGGDRNTAGFLLRVAQGMERVSADSGSIWGGIKNEPSFYQLKPEQKREYRKAGRKADGWERISDAEPCGL